MPSAPSLKGLLFDFDDTLVPASDVANAVMANLCAEVSAACGVDAQELKATLLNCAESILPTTPAGKAAEEFFSGSISFPTHAHELLWEDKSPFENLAPDLPGFRIAVWSAACESLGLGGQIEPKEMSERLVAEIAALRVPYPETEGVLKELARRFRMAILTNGEPSVQGMKIKRSGLDRHFDHVVHGAEHGSKPRPRPYEVVLELIGCDPSEAAMIGDTLPTDIRGARDFGIYSIWVNRTSRVNETDIAPDAEIQDMGQLLELIRPVDS